MIRLFLPDSPDLAKGVSIVLPPDPSRYLGAVMRKGPGDEILVFNGRDGEWLARIDAVGKKSVTLIADRRTRPQPQGQGPVLLVALIKRARLATIVEKATELGASKVQLLITHRSNSDHTNVERLTLIAREAAEQTERLDVPEILAPVKLDRLLDGLDYSAVFFGDEDSTHEDDKATLSMLKAVEGSDPDRAAILIGPEGGFDDDERQRLRALPNVHPVNLGPRILRADTAAISALTLFQAAAGDWT
ncbi:16S rRNA (uracil(1498)-N(3))-methyltransferase [Asticcacaulis solisilvae]|uniref:16S rRNA (uracil(1498)-N(3))-methyltransferase n=1 Tax=Asticcacaulis solisilvae TaxID=1217274 RepID=UPI003FD8CDCF